MRVFISCSVNDQKPVARIAEALQKDGHQVWFDVKGSFSESEEGCNFVLDSISRAFEGDVGSVGAFIFIISRNSFRSQWMQREFSAIALQQISTGESKIIPVKIDQSEIPGYISENVNIDLSQDFESGLQILREILIKSPDANFGMIQTKVGALAESRAPQIATLRETLRQGKLTLVCGAGISVEAGIPAWGVLLVGLLEKMMETLSKDHSIKVKEGDAKEFERLCGGSSLILGKYLKNNFGKEFPKKIRDVLYAKNPTTSPIIDSIVDLARPQRNGSPLDSIITFNFDCLVEERLGVNNIKNKPVFTEDLNHDQKEIPVYHVHGYLPRKGEIPDGELVFSEDAYHTQFIDPYSWSNLIQLTKLTQNTCLFVGISLTDPNMRRLLDVAWRKNPENKAHYIIKRLPKYSGQGVFGQFAKVLEEQDANKLGLNVIWVEEFCHIPEILKEISSS